MCSVLHGCSVEHSRLIPVTYGHDEHAGVGSFFLRSALPGWMILVQPVQHPRSRQNHQRCDDSLNSPILGRIKSVFSQVSFQRQVASLVPRFR